MVPLRFQRVLARSNSRLVAGSAAGCQLQQRATRHMKQRQQRGTLQMGLSLLVTRLARLLLLLLLPLAMELAPRRLRPPLLIGPRPCLESPAPCLPDGRGLEGWT